MNKLKALLPLLFVMLSITLHAEKTKVKVVGKIKGLKTNQIMIINRYRDEIATGVSEKGKFELEFKVDSDKDIRFCLYIPSLSDVGMNPGYIYDFYADVKEVRLKGKIKGDKVIDFVADSPMNNDYRRFKFGGRSTKARLKAMDEVKKAEKEYEKYIIPTGKVEDCRDLNDPKAKELQKKASDSFSKLSNLEYKCSMEAVDMLTSTPNKGLNALIYATLNGYKGSYLKPAIEKYRSLYSDKELEKDYYTRELLRSWRIKAVRMKGEEIIDYDFIDLKGGKVNFADFKGKYLYVNFYDVSFKPSLEELAVIQKLEKQYKDNNIVFLHMNVNKDMDAWRKYCDENNLSENHIHINDNTNLFNTYRLKDLPRGVLIDKNSKMHTYYIGKQYGDRDEEGKPLNNGKTAEDILKEISGKL